MYNLSFDSKLNQARELVDSTLSRLLQEKPIDSNLMDVLRYTLTSPGKRIRSVLLLWCCELVAGSVNHNAEVASASVEMVHTYSLVHDDLPAMDNDDFRRGRPACHKAFNEATAILAGDALLTLAFEILAKEIDTPAVAVQLISELAEAAGPAGMIAGQLADLEAENTPGRLRQAQSSRKEILEYIHSNKTAKMFRCAAAMGAICGGANEKQLKILREFGLKVGLGFQITDDILDVSASSKRLGKTAGKDEKAGKTTYPAVVGMEKSIELARKITDEAVSCVAGFGPKADILRHLAIALLNRTK